MNGAVQLFAKPRPHQSRQGDRRAGFETLASALGRAIGRDNCSRSLREVFEETLKRALPVRAVHLRRLNPLARPRERADTIVIDVPAYDPHSRSVMECMLEPAWTVGAWDRQVLRAAANLAGLALEIGRTRLEMARAAQAGLEESKDDGSGGLSGW